MSNAGYRGCIRICVASASAATVSAGNFAIRLVLVGGWTIMLPGVKLDSSVLEAIWDESEVVVLAKLRGLVLRLDECCASVMAFIW